MRLKTRNALPLIGAALMSIPLATTTPTASQVVDGVPTKCLNEQFHVIGQAEATADSAAIQTDLVSVGDAGVDRDNPLDSIYWQSEFSEIVQLLTEKDSGLSFAEIDPVKDSAAIGFAGCAPKDLPSLIERSLPEVVVDVMQGTGYTEAQSIALTTAVHYATLDQRGVLDVATEFSKDGTVLTLIRTTGAIDEGRISRAVRDAISSDATLPRTAAVEIEFQFTSEAISGEEAIYGGQAMTTCTSGFSVKKSGYPNGMLTAEHCSNTQSQGGYTLSFRSAMSKSYGDVQWHSLTATTADSKFYSSPGSLRSVTGTRSPLPGDRICFNGKSTGSHCAFVNVINVCSSGYCRLTRMTTHQTAAGDSGGPWYSLNSAIGIHRGWMSCGSGECAVFTPIQNALSQLGLTLKT